MYVVNIPLVINCMQIFVNRDCIVVPRRQADAILTPSCSMAPDAPSVGDARCNTWHAQWNRCPYGITSPTPHVVTAANTTMPDTLHGHGTQNKHRLVTLLREPLNRLLSVTHRRHAADQLSNERWEEHAPPVLSTGWSSTWF